MVNSIFKTKNTSQDKLLRLKTYILFISLVLLVGISGIYYSETNSSNNTSTKIIPPSNSKDLTSQHNVTIKIIPGHGVGQADLSPKNVKVNVGTTVVWQNLIKDRVYLQSLADSTHPLGGFLDVSYIYPGESHSEILDEVGTFTYAGHAGYGSYYVRGYMTVVNTSIVENNYNINRIQWHNFTNDLAQFSVEYPSQWQVKIGNRFNDEPPLTVENTNSGSSLGTFQNSDKGI